MKENLNELKIPSCGDDELLQNNSRKDGDVEVLFRNHKNKIIELCQNNDFAIGCIAWLTDYEILEALSKINTTIVVQKEDFLRPDFHHNKNKLQNRIGS